MISPVCITHSSGQMGGRVIKKPGICKTQCVGFDLYLKKLNMYICICLSFVSKLPV